MAKFRLDIVESHLYRGTYNIGWYGGPPGEEAEGDLCLGESGQGMDHDHVVASKAVAKLADLVEPGGGRLNWESYSGAKRSLVVARAAIKNMERTLQDWEIKAIEAGWKAPKGWK